MVPRALRWFFSKPGTLGWLRFGVGVAGLVVGGWVLNPGGSLGLALLLFGAFVLVHAGIDQAFQILKVNKTYSPADAEAGLRDFAASFVATSGVILGLLAVFATSPFSDTIKVGIAALVADILVGTALVGLLLAGAAQTAEDQPAWNLIRYVFNVALWGLTLGLLCIAMGLIYR